MTTHLLHHGRPLCGFSEKLPGEWPYGHTWVRWVEFDALPLEAKCPDCARAQPRRRTWREDESRALTGEPSIHGWTLRNEEGDSVASEVPSEYAKQLQFSGEALDALEAVSMLAIECLRSGNTAPSSDCDCSACEAVRRVREVLSKASPHP